MHNSLGFRVVDAIDNRLAATTPFNDARFTQFRKLLERVGWRMPSSSSRVETEASASMR